MPLLELELDELDELELELDELELDELELELELELLLALPLLELLLELLELLLPDGSAEQAVKAVMEHNTSKWRNVQGSDIAEILEGRALVKRSEQPVCESHINRLQAC